MFGRASRAACLAALTGLLTLAAWAVVSEEAEAVHFWSGTLSWERVLPAEATDVLGTDAAVRVTGWLSWDSTPAQFAAGGTGCSKLVDTIIPSDEANRAALTVADVEYKYVMKVKYADQYNPPLGHCRFAAKIIDPGQVASEQGVLVPLPPAGGPLEVWWGNSVLTFCCRENLNHVNNANKQAKMGTTLTPGDPNSSPVVDFARLTTITSHGAFGYGNHHCPKNALCKFYVYASDPDNDTLTWSLGGPADAGSGFMQPGPPWTGPYAINPSTGLVTWDTTGASVGQIYSTHILVADGVTKVPLDFMVEIGPGCENGAVGVLDPVTGELYCDEERPPPPPEARCDKNPDDDGCRPVPPTPPRGKTYEHTFWPAPREYLDMPPAVSDSEATASDPADATVSDISGLDSDGDSISDDLDRCPGSDTPLNNDMDNDGLGDGCDDDDDGDGILDEMDACPLDPDPDCGTDSQGNDVAAGKDAARGFLSPAAPVAKDNRGAAVHEASSTVANGLPLLGLLAAAVLLVLVVAARRRKDD